MAKNNGKKFEQVIRESFEKIDGVSVDRIPDQTTKYKGSTNICDFMVYKYPKLFYLECKSVHGNTFSIHSEPKLGRDGELHGFYGNIRDNQWEGLLEKSKIPGVVSGVIIWWVDKDVTRFFTINSLANLREDGKKSIRFDQEEIWSCEITGTKKRTYFDYDMLPFLDLNTRRA